MVGNRIRMYRKLRGLTQGELAARVGMDQSKVSRLEHGRTPTRVKDLEDLASALGCSIHDLLDDGPDGKDDIIVIIRPHR